MNVTKGMSECRKQVETYCQKDSAEHEEYDRGHSVQRITENNVTNSHRQEFGLLERILSRDNLNQAYKKVKSNKGSGGVDKMTVDQLLGYIRLHGDGLIQSIYEGKYRPQPVRRVEIPKDNGKTRKLGIPTVIDRMIQQAIAQVLTPMYERQFSEDSFGFRPRRSQHDALRRCQEYINEGYGYVVDMDLEQYFDTVNHSLLIQILSNTIKDGRVISLIHKFLNAGILVNGLFETNEQGVPQGGPLSPLLGNIMLNELDKELESRNHRFVRFADDLLIFCRTERSGIRTYQHILPFIENHLRLKVNREKTKVAHIRDIKFLGYGFYIYKKECRFRVHPKSVQKLKESIREITGRNKGISVEERKKKLNQKITGWVNYFKLADMKTLMERIDQWTRRRLRMVTWKIWKRVKTRYKWLRKLGCNHNEALKWANTRKGYWRIAGSKILDVTLTNKLFHRAKYKSFLEHYMSVRL